MSVRHAHVLVKQALLLAAAVVVSGAGCAGCTIPIPFSVTKTGTIALGLGPVNAECDNQASSGDAGDSAGGDVAFTFEHHTEGNTCVLTSTWHGTLVDMAEVKKEAESQITVGGNADIEDTQIKSVEIDVDKLQLKDGDKILDAGAGLLGLDATVDVLGQKDVIVAHVEGSDVEHPDITVDTSDTLIQLINEAFQNGAKVDGDGTCEVDQDLDKIQALTAAEAPSMVLDFKLKVKGTTHASL